LKTFFYLSLPFLLISAVLFIRLLVLFVQDNFKLVGHLQSLLIAIMLAIVGFLVLMFGLIADRIGDSRRLMEEILYRLRQAEIDRDTASPVDRSSWPHDPTAGSPH
jgi:hypothetical protein